MKIFKLFTAACFVILTATLTLAANHDAGSDADDEAKSIEYRGKALEGFKILNHHRVIATYGGIERHCMYRSGRCNDQCKCEKCIANTAGYAMFAVKDYLLYARPGGAMDVGNDRYKSYPVRVQNTHGDPVGEEQLNAVIGKLKQGDLVLMEWKQFYGEATPGDPGSVRSFQPILMLKKLTEQQAKALRARAGLEQGKKAK